MAAHSLSPSRAGRTILAAGPAAGLLEGLAARVNAWLRGTRPDRVSNSFPAPYLARRRIAGALLPSRSTYSSISSLHSAATVFVLTSLRVPILVTANACWHSHTHLLRWFADSVYPAQVITF